jgi:hypothetical protein
MIIAAVLMLFGGGGGLQLLPFDFSQRVEQAVPEGARRDSILDLYKQSLEGIEDYGKDVQDQLDAFFNVLKGHDMPVDSLVPLAAEVRWDYISAAQKGIEWRRQLVDLLSPQEWDQVFADE